MRSPINKMNADFNFFLLDTFTDKTAKGNPSPVCLLQHAMPVQQMHTYAREFNQPVTAFIDISKKTDTHSIRYFTITGEIPACGHATLAAAFVLFKATPHIDSVNFKTVEGVVLKATKEDGLTFIQYPAFKASEIAPTTNLMASLGINRFKSCFFCEELESLFLELENAETVRKMKPNYEKMLQSSSEIKEVVVMSESDDAGSDVILRSFCPWIGINEDPVTGSIHSVLGHFWKNRLNKDLLKVNQVSERGGKIIVKVFEDFIKIGGNCRLYENG